MKCEVFDKLLSIKSYWNDNRIGDDSRGTSHYCDSVIYVINWLGLKNRESQSLVASTFLIITRTDNLYLGASSHWAWVWRDIKNFGVSVVVKPLCGARSFSSTVNCNFDVIPEHMIGHLWISLSVVQRWRVALDSLVIHDCGISLYGLIEYAEHLVTTHINEVFASNCDLSESIIRTANGINEVDYRLLIIEVLESWWEQVKFQGNRERNESRMVWRRSDAFNLWGR